MKNSINFSIKKRVDCLTGRAPPSMNDGLHQQMALHNTNRRAREARCVTVQGKLKKDYLKWKRHYSTMSGTYINFSIGLERFQYTIAQVTKQ